MMGARPEMALHNKQQNQELNTNCYILEAATKKLQNKSPTEIGQQPWPPGA